MSQFLVVILGLLISVSFSCCTNDVEGELNDKELDNNPTVKNSIVQEENKVRYEPENEFQIKTDTSLLIKDEEYVVSLVNFNTPDDIMKVELDYGGGEMELVYYRNTSSTIKISKDNKDIFSDTLTKNSFIELIGKDNLEQIILLNMKIAGVGDSSSEIEFVFNYVIPDTDVRFLVLFSIDRDGNSNSKLLEDDDYTKYWVN